MLSSFSTNLVSKLFGVTENEEEVVTEEPAVEESEEGELPAEAKEYSYSLNTTQINDIGSALEEAADIETAKAADESNDNYEEEEDRDFSYDEQKIFEDFLDL